MTIEEIDDHAEQIRDRYPDRYRTAANHQKLIDIFGSRFQELETQLFKILDERHLSVAVGVQLDGLGQILDLERELGESDESYRARLVGRTGELSKSGEMENLITSFLTLSQATSVFASDFYPAGVLLVALTDIDAEDPAIDQAIIDQMALVKAGGIKLILEFAPETDYYELSDVSEVDGSNNGPISSTNGLGDESLTEGGGLARVIT
jgi:hypothetical protein